MTTDEYPSSGVDPAGRMTVAVFGASGRTGRQVVAGALDQPMRVRALLRSEGGLEDLEKHVEVTVGSLTIPENVGRVVEGSQAVCCVFGPRPPYTDLFCAAAMETIVDQMRRHGSRRIVCQTGAMIGNYTRNRTFPAIVQILSKRGCALASRSVSDLAITLPTATTLRLAGW